jgi:hypothetical protein
MMMIFLWGMVCLGAVRAAYGHGTDNQIKSDKGIP